MKHMNNKTKRLLRQIEYSKLTLNEMAALYFKQAFQRYNMSKVITRGIET